ncbi:MAG: hypothetical protein K9W43_13795 [Candidatus Thorarchaeota archaeon]|nr:hypothetical protein [Candidatus Thorarchaeota archaeon]
MYEARYHNEKPYIPRVIRERLRLNDGDTVRFNINGKGTIQLVVLTAEKATSRLLHHLANPPDLGEVIGTVRRIEIYDDIA